MTAIEVIGIVVIALLIGAIFFYGFKNTGPWGSLWSFILIIFLGVLFVDVLAEPVGPLWYGVAWFDLIFVGFLFAFLLAAATPTRPPRRDEQLVAEEVRSEESGAAVALG
ncbi:MAG TPA: hypothetical protein VJ949_13720, partial [Cryomorphaceae bacterium]|nr:hypothetical protein [Cryomorphaceae bacterium]